MTNQEGQGAEVAILRGCRMRPVGFLHERPRRRLITALHGRGAFGSALGVAGASNLSNAGYDRHDPAAIAVNNGRAHLR